MIDWSGLERRRSAPSVSELILLELEACPGCGRLKRSTAFCGCPYMLRLEVARRLGVALVL